MKRPLPDPPLLRRGGGTAATLAFALIAPGAHALDTQRVDTAVDDAIARYHLPGIAVGVKAPTLPGLSDVEVATADVWATGISVDSYPTQFVREGLDAAGVLRVEQAFRTEEGRRVAVAGVVTHRQRPGTANGVTLVGSTHR